MACGFVEIEIFQGNSKHLSVSVKESGVAVDLTGYDATFMVKQKPNDPDAQAIMALTVGSGITLTDPVNGLFDVDIAPTDTAGVRIKPGDLEAECRYWLII